MASSSSMPIGTAGPSAEHTEADVEPEACVQVMYPGGRTLEFRQEQIPGTSEAVHQIVFKKFATYTDGCHQIDANGRSTTSQYNLRLTGQAQDFAAFELHNLTLRNEDG
eukprot:4451117-Prymnesium_polylepis.1